MATVKKNGLRATINGIEHICYRGRMMPIVAGGAPTMTIEEFEERQTEIRGRLQELDNEYAGRQLPEETVTEWNSLNEELERNDKLLEELRARRARIEELSTSEGNREAGVHFQTRSPGSATGEDIYDLTTIRMSMTNPGEAVRELRDRARRSIEAASFPHQLDKNDCVRHIERLIDRHDDPENRDSVPGEISRRILATGSQSYKRAFRKYIASKALTPDEQRALAIGTGSTGGFAVVYTLDPTIIPTSNLSVNPFRRISRVETIAGTNEWRGVTSAGVTASRVAEGTEAADNSPALAQPAVVVQRVQSFVPFSIELGQDWGSLQSDMVQLIQDAKDDEEANSFTNGNGTPPAAQGILTGATTTVPAGGVASFAVGDLYATEQALGPRFRPRAQWLGNRFIYNKVRQFDTAGGASLWTPLPAPLREGLANDPGGNMNAQLIGYPSNEDSQMPAALTTGSKVLILGDWRYFVIVDRIGMDMEIVPHLFGATNRYPTGQRGAFAYWRNNSRALDANAFRTLVTS